MKLPRSGNRYNGSAGWQLQYDMRISKAKIGIKQQNTLAQFCQGVKARLTAELVLPTPPLPLVTAIEIAMLLTLRTKQCFPDSDQL